MTEQQQYAFDIGKSQAHFVYQNPFVNNLSGFYFQGHIIGKISTVCDKMRSKRYKEAMSKIDWGSNKKRGEELRKAYNFCKTNKQA